MVSPWLQVNPTMSFFSECVDRFELYEDRLRFGAQKKVSNSRDECEKFCLQLAECTGYDWDTNNPPNDGNR